MSVSPQTLILNFKESPYSPWGSEIASRSRAGSRPLPTAKSYSATVGRISAVNKLIGERGLEHKDRLPPLVVDSQHRSDKAYWRKSIVSCSSGESDSESEMDRRWRRGRGARRRRARQHQKPPSNNTARLQVTGVDEGSKPLSLDDSDSESDEEEEEEEEGKHPADTTLIELASFPGYDPDNCTPLPHGLEPLEQMKRVTRAQIKLASKREGFREAWKHMFYSPASLAIYQDYFWWYFLHHYQAGQHTAVQDLLFARISKNYVRLLCDPIEERWRSAFFKVYPDLVAQCVYSTFIHAYPTSWNSFDGDFKTELCQFISLWQVGTKPLPNSWEQWELSLLEPSNLLKHMVKEEQKSSVKDAKSPRRGTFNLDSLIKEAQKQESDAIEKTSQRGSTSQCSSSVLSSESQHGETKQILLSDIEMALVSPSASHHRLSPRSSTSSSKVAHPETNERRKTERAREQLSSLKKLLVEKTSSQVLQQTSSVPEPKQKQHKLSNSPKQSMTSCPKPKPAHKGGTSNDLGKKCVANSVGVGKTAEAGAEKEESKKTWKEKALALRAKQKREEELVPLEGPGFEHSVFNVCGHSPLVKFFLKNKNLKHKKEHSTLVKRTEISEQPPAQAVCYKDVLDQSKEFERKNQSSFKRHYQHQKQSMARYQQTRKDASAKHEQAVQKVLSNKKETSQLSNELTVHVLKNQKSSNRTAVSKAVNETLDRVVHPKTTG